MISRLRFLIKVSLFLFLSILYLNSSFWFRLKIIDFYKKNHQFAKAIQLYDKILRKNSIKSSLSDKKLAMVNFDSGHLYAELNFTNSAIESYRTGILIFPQIEMDNYYFKNNLEKDRLLAMGLLESGRPDKAIEEFKKIKALYPHSTDIERYINTAMELKNNNLILKNKNFFFLLGDSYINNQLFDEARAFFTKRIIDYGVEPLAVLVFLQKKYSNNTEIIRKVWGKEIYVTLEDFEKTNVQLANWLSRKSPKVNEHKISNDKFFKGSYSEFFDLVYSPERKPWDYDLWAKSVEIPLDSEDLILGMRFYVYTVAPFPFHIAIDIEYRKAGVSGTFDTDVDMSRTERGWIECKIDDLCTKAKNLASGRNWITKEMILRKIMFNCQNTDTVSVDNAKFFIDEIELYCLSK